MTKQEIEKAQDEARLLRETDVSRAIELCDQCIAASESIGYIYGVAYFRQVLGDCLRRQDRYSEAEQQFLITLDLCTLNDFKSIRLSTLLGLGIIARRLHHDPAKALEYYLHARDEGAAIQDFNIEVQACVNISIIFNQLGEATQGTEALERGLRVAAQMGSERHIVICLSGLASAMLAVENYEASLALYEDIAFRAEQCGMHMPWCEALSGICTIHHTLNNLEAARNALDRLLAIAPSTGIQSVVATAAIRNAEQLTLEGHAYKAIMEFEKALSLTAQNIETNAHALKCLAQIRSSEGDYANALQFLLRARALMESVGTGMWLGPILRDLAKAYRMSGEMAKAFETLDEVQALESKNRITAARSRLSAIHTFLSIEREKHLRELTELRLMQAEKDLAANSLMTIAQNEILTGIRLEITALLKSHSRADQLSKSLRELLRRLPTAAVDWDKYESQFKAVHPEFARQVLERWPEITATELRVCSLLRMNLRSDQIAKIFGVSERTIESHRFWIRKKMGLAEGEDLAIFLAKL